MSPADHLRQHLVEVHHLGEDELDGFASSYPMATLERLHDADHRVGYYGQDHRSDAVVGPKVLAEVAS